MEQHKKKEAKNDLLNLETEKESPRKKQQIEKNTSSNPTSRFEKKHGRTHHPLGDGHEPGTLPGGGV